MVSLLYKYIKKPKKTPTTLRAMDLFSLDDKYERNTINSERSYFLNNV